MNTLCYSVRLESLYKISDKCYKAICFDGSEDLIPAKFVFGQDYDLTGNVGLESLIDRNIEKKISMSEYFKQASINDIKQAL